MFIGHTHMFLSSPHDVVS